MYKATCSDCVQTCEVPFRPSGEKPVYCSNCFGQGDNRKGDNKKHDEINAKLDKILFLLQRTNSVERVPPKEVAKKPASKKITSKKKAK